MNLILHKSKMNFKFDAQKITMAVIPNLKTLLNFYFYDMQNIYFNGQGEIVNF